MKKHNKVKVQESEPLESKGKRGPQEYKCGDDSCGKIYHSYTAFYNHCKKSHGGEFPPNSLENGEKFQGPTKNRGRPRIKKNQVKDLVQIESMKKENELIEFMGTLDKKKSQELIVYVQNPIKRVEDAVVQVKEWLRKSSNGGLKQDDKKYLDDLEQFNKIIGENDLPQFYDPIETHNYPNKLDSYSFSSVQNFMAKPEMRKQFGIKFDGKQLLFKIYLCWSARMLSQSLFNEVLYLIMQFERNPTNRRDIGASKQDFLKLLFEKKDKFKALIGQFFDCLLKEHQKSNQGNASEKRQKQQGFQELRQSNKRKNPVSDKKFASDEGKEQDDEDDESNNSDGQEDDENEEVN